VNHPLDDLIWDTDYYPSRAKAQLASEIERVNATEQRLARRQRSKAKQRRRDLACIAAVLGCLACGLATLAWWVALPAAVVLLGLGMWGVR
jgi:fatty acid desaturase